MNLNKIVSTVLIVLMLLDGAIPASAGGGQKRTIEQREGDSIIVDRYIPQKRRRLESSEIIGTQGLKRTFLIDGTNLIVMSLEKTPVMAFACFSDAVRWLRVNGWNCRGAPSIKNAILKKYLSCGWRWDIQIKTKETEKLLVSNPTEEQMREAKGFNIISSMGMGNKLDPTKIVVTDIYKTHTCPLAKVLRRELKDRRIKKLKVVYSTEQPRELQERIMNGRKVTPGSISFVPSVGGLTIASVVVRELLER